MLNKLLEWFLSLSKGQQVVVLSGIAIVLGVSGNWLRKAGAPVPYVDRLPFDPAYSPPTNAAMYHGGFFMLLAGVAFGGLSILAFIVWVTSGNGKD